MITRTRFAPSPTGYMHIASLRGALINFAFARKLGGEFLLRIDDTDTQRSTKEYEEQIINDMSWSELNYDQIFKQSQRKDIYRTALLKLAKAGFVYPCFETKEELETKRAMQIKFGKPPLYDRESLKSNKPERYDSIEIPGAHWRFFLERMPVSWQDIIKGHIEINCEHLSDPIVMNSEGEFLYGFASVVDDIDKKITHIIRGEDHLINTATQVQIFQALSDSNIQFGHYPVLKSIEGKKLSKRDGDSSIKELRKSGVSAMALNSLLMTIGFSEKTSKFFYSIDEMIAEFDINTISKSPMKTTVEMILKYNKQWLLKADYSDISSEIINHLDKNTINEIDNLSVFWDIIKHEISSMSEISEIARIITNNKKSVTKLELEQLNNLVQYLGIAKKQKCLGSCKCESITNEQLESAINKFSDKKQICNRVRHFIIGRNQGPSIIELINFIKPCKFSFMVSHATIIN